MHAVPLPSPRVCQPTAVFSEGAAAAAAALLLDLPLLAWLCSPGSCARLYWIRKYRATRCGTRTAVSTDGKVARDALGKLALGVFSMMMLIR
eukprot:COSAG04_NODE_1871_length_5346_cov_4.349914_4_plen_92_part_00